MTPETVERAVPLLTAAGAALAADLELNRCVHIGFRLQTSRLPNPVDDRNGH